MVDLKTTSRLSELDWLRVILIFAVFLHHVCMPFNGDGWHIMNDESSKVLDDIMVYFEQVRLPTLFFISGVGTIIVLSKVSNGQYIKHRVLRLLVPLIVGILFIVPPQNYIEQITELGSFWQAYPALALDFDSNHLWFIEYLILFAVLAIPLTSCITSTAGRRLTDIIERISQAPSGLFSLVTGLIVIRVGLKMMSTHEGDMLDSLSTSLFYLYLFCCGLLFVTSTTIWQSIADNRRRNLLWLAISSALFYGYYYSPDLSEYLSITTRWAIWWLVCCLVTWSSLLTLLGYGQRYFTTTPNWLKLSNELIYPFYILHQTVIVILGYFIIAWSLSIWLKVILLLVLSFTITGSICLFLIYPLSSLRVLFGLKPIKKVNIR